MPTSIAPARKSHTPVSPATTLIQPYLFFNGRADEAIEFYRRALGAEVVMLMRFKDSPTPPKADEGQSLPPGFENKIMHANLRIGGTELLLSDACTEQPPKFEGFSLSLLVPTVAEANRRFAALAEGGRIHALLAKTFFSAAFGMLADRFGVSWMVYVTPET